MRRPEELREDKKAKRRQQTMMHQLSGESGSAEPLTWCQRLQGQPSKRNPEN
jgi:hypothetical protein